MTVRELILFLEMFPEHMDDDVLIKHLPSTAKERELTIAVDASPVFKNVVEVRYDYDH